MRARILSPGRVRVLVTAAVLTAVAGTGVELGARQQAASGQSTQANQGVVLKGRAPVSTEVLKVTLPKPRRATLPNGLDLMVLEDHRLPQVSFQIVIPGAGGYYDPPDRVGLSSIVAALMREGTTSRSSAEISEALETMAASVNVGAGASSGEATVSGSSLVESFGETFALAADVLLHPTFPDEEIARYRQRTQAQLVQLRTNPNFLASERFDHVIYGDHPGGRTFTTPETLAAVTRDLLVQTHKARFVPDHAIVAVAGDTTLEQVRALVEKALAGWTSAGTPEPATTDPAPMGPAHVHFVARPNSVQSNFIVGTQAISRTSPDYPVLEVMNAVIGGGPTGRLFTILREAKGYTYGAYSGLSAGKFRGDWQANTDVRTEVTEPALRDLLFEISRMRDELVPEQEFADKKRALIASFALSLESPASVLNRALTLWTYGLPADYWDTYPARIDAVTREQVQAAAKRYLDPARLQIVVVGDPVKAGPVLGTFGDVITYDTNGNRTGGGVDR
ncbi:MAG: pitrilysin family protein [Vicinamibacterales bacterium]